MKEIWKDIPGYEGRYQVSSFGNVASLIHSWGVRKTPKILKPTIAKDGYYYLALHKDKKQRTFKIHVLVAMTFLNHQPDSFKIVVGHLNHEKLDNRLENIYLISNRENCSDYRTNVGAGWDSRAKGWRSQIYIGKSVFLGVFDKEQDAANMYQKALANIDKFDGCPKKFRELLAHEI